jgi:predicted transcriptional regulator
LTLYVKQRIIVFMEPTYYTDEQVIDILAERRGDRTQKELAREIGVSPQHLNDVFNHRRAAGPSILRYLGLEYVIVKSDRAA